MEIAVIVGLSTAFLIELLLILFKINTIRPLQREKEKQANRCSRSKRTILYAWNRKKKGNEEAKVYETLK